MDASFPVCAFEKRFLYTITVPEGKKIVGVKKMWEIDKKVFFWYTLIKKSQMITVQTGSGRVGGQAFPYRCS